MGSPHGHRRRPGLTSAGIPIIAIRLQLPNQCGRKPRGAVRRHGEIAGDREREREGTWTAICLTGTRQPLLSCWHDGRKTASVTGTGLLARCLQHEADHLDGIVYLDRLPDDERAALLAAAGLPGD